jgi:hypothetical protein
VAEERQGADVSTEHLLTPRNIRSRGAHLCRYSIAANVDECLCSFAHRISPLHTLALSVLLHVGDQEEDPSVAGELFSANVVVIEFPQPRRVLAAMPLAGHGALSHASLTVIVSGGSLNQGIVRLSISRAVARVSSCHSPVSDASFAGWAVCFSLRAMFRVCHDVFSVFGFGFSFFCDWRLCVVVGAMSLLSVLSSRHAGQTDTA